MTPATHRERNFLLFVLSVCGFLLLWSNAVSFAQTVSFGAAANFPVPGNGNVRAVAVGDLNGDGKQDLAAVSFNNNVVTVFLGDGTGSFVQKGQFPAGKAVVSVAIGDLNGDGKPDVVAGNLLDGTLSVFLGDGTGSLGAANNIPVGSPPLSVAIGDLNGDGKLDMAVALGSNYVSILLGNGDGTFRAAATYAAGLSPFYVVIGDFNGDGVPDLAVANSNGATVSVLIGNGNGTFGTATDFPVGGNPYCMSVGDFNGDGKMDLAVGDANLNKISVLLGDGRGGFGAVASFATGGGSARSVAVGDLNGDGRADLAVANSTTNTVSVLMGHGDGTFGAPSNFTVGTDSNADAYSVAIGDFNGDGRPDLAVANLFNFDISVLLNTTPFYSLTVTVAGGGSGKVNLSPSGINCASTCSGSFGTGTAVTITATPVSGSVFAGWSGGCAGSAVTCTLNMNADTTVTANFNLNSYSLGISKIGTGGGTVTSSPAGINCGMTCKASFVSGTVVNLTAVPASGSAFGGWSGGCAGTSLTCAVTVKTGTSVAATFILSTNPPPTIASVSPASVYYGVTTSKAIAIQGTNIVPGATITVGTLTGTTVYTGTAGATAANPYVYYNSGAIYFWWPNTSLTPGSYTVTVTNPAIAGGRSVSFAGGFKVYVPQPAITGLSPASVYYGVTTNRSVAIQGNNIAPGATITVGTLTGTAIFSGTARATPSNPYVYYNSGTVYFWWPNTSLAPGSYTVTVTNPADAGGLSAKLAGGFTVAAPQPAVTSLSPASVSYGVTASKSVAIRGVNLLPGATITVGTLKGTTVYTGIAGATAVSPFVYYNSGNVYFWWLNTSLPKGVYNVIVTNPAPAGGLSGTLTGGFVVN